MSRDQRPGRAVMVDSVRDAPDSARAGEAVEGDAAVVPAPPAPAKSSIVLPSILFLLACAAGAAGVALMPHWGV